MVRTTRLELPDNIIWARYRDIVQKSLGQSEVCAALDQAVERFQDAPCLVTASASHVTYSYTLYPWSYATPPPHLSITPHPHLSVHMFFSVRFCVLQFAQSRGRGLIKLVPSTLERHLLASALAMLCTREQESSGDLRNKRSRAHPSFLRCPIAGRDGRTSTRRCHGLSTGSNEMALERVLQRQIKRARCL